MKYVGSKNKYAKELLPIILKDRKPGQPYVEPFCGGCNLIDKVDNPRIANDAHPYLIPLLRHVQHGGGLVDTVTEDLYKMVKDNPNVFTEWFVGFIGFNCSFGAKWFNGYARNAKKGAPDADVKNTGEGSYVAQAARNLMAQAPKLEGIQFQNTSYDQMQIPANSIIYFDPPYAGTVKYKGTSFDYERFWDFVRHCWVKGHQVFVSEYNAPDDFICVWEKKVVSNLHTDRAVNKYETEKLFTYDL